MFCVYSSIACNFLRGLAKRLILFFSAGFAILSDAELLIRFSFIFNAIEHLHSSHTIFQFTISWFFAIWIQLFLRFFFWMWLTSRFFEAFFTTCQEDDLFFIFTLKELLLTLNDDDLSNLIWIIYAIYLI